MLTARKCFASTDTTAVVRPSGDEYRFVGQTVAVDVDNGTDITRLKSFGRHWFCENHSLVLMNHRYLSRIVQIGGQGQVQSSTTKPVTRDNSRTLFVIKIVPALSAWAAIMLSRGPMGVPCDSN